eukprot:scaffold204459_cov17-Tisochrysis_lutea.AAC.1
MESGMSQPPRLCLWPPVSKSSTRVLSNNSSKSSCRRGSKEEGKTRLAWGYGLRPTHWNRLGDGSMQRQLSPP